MTEVSEKTNSRVAQLSIMSLGVGIVLVASLFQVWHLKHHFQKKKIIELPYRISKSDRIMDCREVDNQKCKSFVV
ncbi:hypothetical protein BVRB_4g079830 isoform B [Beta vulgaris subsp. vulgaris]|nr:hypothetical protein BVRB_4g079830 isoform B [Beta vulgaris subsp. vulgaris]